MNKLLIAMVAHEINRAYCVSLGDDSQPAWDEAPEAQQKSILAGVEMHLANPDATPEQSHESWLKQKVNEGWKYGKTKDAGKKLHPCCLPYAELPQEQRTKDYLFKATVHAVKLLPDEIAKDIEADVRARTVPSMPNIAPETLQGRTPVRYIGRPAQWIERKYKTGLAFTKNQVRSLPDELARKLLRHSDLFELADSLPESQPDLDLDDDTEQQLAKAKTEREQSDEVHEEAQALRESVLNMDKDSLSEFAFTRYQQTINKRRSVENLREEVVGFVDQYGVV